MKKKKARKKKKKTWHRAMAKVGSAKSPRAWMKAMGSFPNRRKKRKKNSRPRRRNRTVNFPFPVTPGQKKKLKGFLSRLTGKRVRFK